MPAGGWRAARRPEDLVAAAPRPALDFSSYDDGAHIYDASVPSVDVRTVLRVDAVGHEATAVPSEDRSRCMGGVRCGSAFVVAAKSATSPVGRKVVTKEFGDGVATKYGWEMPVAPGTNSPGVIGGRGYSGHALDQMQSRGFVSTVYCGSANNASVVVNSNNRVITVSCGDLGP